MTNETKSEMKRYEVHMVATVRLPVVIEAESPAEAVKLVRERRETLCPPPPSSLTPELVYLLQHDPDFDEEIPILGYEVLGFCEACAVALLDAGGEESPRVYAGDEDGDGVYLCHPCAAKCIEEAGADETSALGGEE